MAKPRKPKGGEPVPSQLRDAPPGATESDIRVNRASWQLKRCKTDLKFWEAEVARLEDSLTRAKGLVQETKLKKKQWAVTLAAAIKELRKEHPDVFDK